MKQGGYKDVKHHEEGGCSLRRSRTLLCLEGVYSPCLIRLSSLSDYVIREAKRPGDGLSNPRGAQSMEAGKKGTELS